MRDGDDEADRAREQYRELLEELRTIIPGVQVLFGFLLTVPFSQRFEELDPLGLRVFALSLVTVGLAVAVLLTPAALHRVAPQGDRHERISLAVRTTIIGLVLLSVSISAAVFVVMRLIFQTGTSTVLWSLPAGTAGAVAAAVVGGGAVLLWFVLPLARRR